MALGTWWSFLGRRAGEGSNTGGQALLLLQVTDPVTAAVCWGRTPCITIQRAPQGAHLLEGQQRGALGLGRQPGSLRYQAEADRVQQGKRPVPPVLRPRAGQRWARAQQPVVHAAGQDHRQLDGQRQAAQAAGACSAAAV